MKEFVKIELLCTEKQYRTIKYLSNFYTEKSLLREKIKKVGEGVLDNETLIKGKKILLKPNWVLHNQKEDDEVCLRTNDSFLFIALDVILEQKPAQIVIGDAPIQRCSWDKMLSKKFLAGLDVLSKKYNIPIIVKDFRRVTFDPSLNNPIKDRNPISDYVIFDLGKESYLESISSNKNIFRVTCYNPDRLGESHRKGVHKYCITKELFDADVIITLPKVKTHQKTGITGALKNLVGVNGDKDYLPHHRIGGKGFGGDCYPGKNYLRLWSEFALDKANRKHGKRVYDFWMYLSIILWKLSLPKKVHDLAAAWHGNDTTWRMVMDINKVAIYGKKDGTLSEEPQRTIYSLCDGIVGGQGNGPLNPTPLPLGFISFSNNSSMTDICMGTLMGFDIHQIPLLEAAHKDTINQQIDVTLNGEKTIYQNLSDFSISTIPPPGWIDYLRIK
jgi:uncharacterized protein (DUF362 family)